MKNVFLFSLIFLSHQAFPQADSSVQNLVFEGAGIRGIAYCGAIQALESQGRLQQIERVGGTSAGAITALAVSLGYSSVELTTLIRNTSFQHLNDGRFIFFGGINRLSKYYGWYRGMRVEKWIAEIIKAKTGNADITFSQLRDTGFKDLYITGTNITKQRAVIFSAETYPDMKVKDAVRISMSIPIYFEAVFMDSTGKTYVHPKNKNGLDIMADGGFIANFPIRLFDSTKYIHPSQPNSFVFNPHTIGFRIDSDAQIGRDTLHKGLADFQVENFKDYVTAFYTLVIESLNRPALNENDWERTVSISDGNISPRIRRLSAQEVETLISNGKAATSKDLN